MADLDCLLVGDLGLLGLSALLVEDSEVVPDLTLVSVERGGFDYVLECLSVVVLLEIDHGERSPVGGLS